MSLELLFDIHLRVEPFPWSAPRVTRNCSYNPRQKQKNQLITLLKTGSKTPTTPHDCPLRLEIVFSFKPPMSLSVRKKTQMINGEILHCKKPDLDNCVKAVVDCLKKVYIADDNQVFEIRASKRYAKHSSIWILGFGITHDKTSGDVDLPA